MFNSTYERMSLTQLEQLVNDLSRRRHEYEKAGDLLSLFAIQEDFDAAGAWHLLRKAEMGLKNAQSYLAALRPSYPDYTRVASAVSDILQTYGMHLDADGGWFQNIGGYTFIISGDLRRGFIINEAYPEAYAALEALEQQYQQEQA